MSSWKEYKFSELCDISRGASPRPIHEYIADKGIPWVKIADATSSGSKYIEKTKEFIIESGRSKSVEVFKGDLILSNSATPGIPKIMNINACIHDGWMLLRNFKHITKDFAYWLLLNERKNLVQQGTGTVFVNLKTDILKNHFVKVPSFNEQNSIVNILNSLDQKIQLNTQINQTLEQIAQAIFKSWFIDFDPVKAKAEAKAQGATDEQANIAAMSVISGKSPDQLNAYKQTNPIDYQQLHQLAQAFPSEFEEIDGVEVPKGWEYAYLKDVCNIVYGKGLPKTKLLPEGYDVFGANGNIGYYSEFMYEKPQVLVGCRGTVGQITMSLPYSFITNNSLIIEYENSPFCLSYLYLYLRNINLKEVSSGSVQPQITIQNMNGVKILKPNDDILSFFSKKIMSTYEYKLKIHFENKSLEKTRDLLLPKLLSGEVGV